jgi:ParB family chromosome partitioning protein
MATKKTPAKPKDPAAPKVTRKKKAEPGSRGLLATDVDAEKPTAEVTALQSQIEADGGRVIGAYREPLGSHWAVLAALPSEKIVPTPFQRDLSEAHVKRLTEVIGKIDRFLDPVIVVRNTDGAYWTPNGHHRTAAMKALGARSIVALVLPDHAVAYKILALNTEKAHNLREKALEVIRMARSLAGIDPNRPEKDYALEFEEPAFITLGVCYEERPRFSGGAYNPILRRVEKFEEAGLGAALAERKAHAAKVLELDDAVILAVESLKAKGFDSPYLKTFVVSRINYLRFVKGEMPSFGEALGKMIVSARKFDPSKVQADQVARAAGPMEGE